MKPVDFGWCGIRLPATRPDRSTRAAFTEDEHLSGAGIAKESGLSFDVAVPVPVDQRAAWRRVAVCVDGSAQSVWTLQAAVAAARRGHAQLTLICVAPPPWPTTGIGGLTLVRLPDDMIREAAETVRRLAAQIPTDVSCRTYARCGGTNAVLEILKQDPHDVLFVGAGSCGALTATGARWQLRRLARCAGPDVVVLSGDGAQLASWRGISSTQYAQLADNASVPPAHHALN